MRFEFTSFESISEHMRFEFTSFESISEHIQLASQTLDFLYKTEDETLSSVLPLPQGELRKLTPFRESF